MAASRERQHAGRRPARVAAAWKLEHIYSERYVAQPKNVITPQAIQKVFDEFMRIVEEETDFESGDRRARVAIENASWGLPETFDGTPVRPLTFGLPHPVAAAVTTTIWLDLETGLPVRQTVRTTFDTSERITEEVYSDWSFEASPSSTFSLPEQP